MLHLAWFAHDVAWEQAQLWRLLRIARFFWEYCRTQSVRHVAGIKVAESVGFDACRYRGSCRTRRSGQRSHEPGPFAEPDDAVRQRTELSN